MINNLEVQKELHIDLERWLDYLTDTMMKSVLETTFSNRMLIKPRRLQEIAGEESNMFIRYASGNHEFVVGDRGGDLAVAGLGQDSIIALTTAIRRSYDQLREEFPAISFDTVETYCNEMLRGYMAGRELEIRKEQERAHEAYIRILEKNR